MDNNRRTAVAFLCGCLHNNGGRRFTYIYDYSTNQHISYNFSNNGGNITIYDYNRGCYLTGRFPSFFDYGVSQYISITKVNNNTFSIYDYYSMNYITVTCNGQSIIIYDYTNGQHFTFSIN